VSVAAITLGSFAFILSFCENHPTTRDIPAGRYRRRWTLFAAEVLAFFARAVGDPFPANLRGASKPFAHPLVGRAIGAAEQSFRILHPEQCGRASNGLAPRGRAPFVASAGNYEQA